VDALEGEKLLIVEILAATPEGLQRTQKHIVCIDSVQAGEGELVVVVQGSSARQAPGMDQMPVDALIIGIVDSLQAFGRILEKQVA
ncbi:MAG: EutN/CcmL family microcompartment protein, partial [Gemmatimonadetes bacterium]|nr:EutN/CcmL family microcompartment protein [Gemmatimonadota bacterium]